MSQRSGLNQGCKRDMNRMNASSKIRVCCEQEKNWLELLGHYWESTNLFLKLVCFTQHVIAFCLISAFFFRVWPGRRGLISPPATCNGNGACVLTGRNKLLEWTREIIPYSLKISWGSPNCSADFFFFLAGSNHTVPSAASYRNSVAASCRWYPDKELFWENEAASYWDKC